LILSRGTRKREPRGGRIGDIKVVGKTLRIATGKEMRGEINIDSIY